MKNIIKTNFIFFIYLKIDKVLVDIEVIKGILNAYRRADKNQSRIYGIILGNKKGNIYHMTDVISGHIFEDGEDEKTLKKI